MRFIVLFMCVSAMQLTAAVYSQEVKVTLSVKDASFESVIRLLEANTEYTFLYCRNRRFKSEFPGYGY